MVWNTQLPLTLRIVPKFVRWVTIVPLGVLRRLVGEGDVVALEVEVRLVAIDLDLILERGDERDAGVRPRAGAQKERPDRVRSAEQVAAEGEGGVGGPQRHHQVDVLVALGLVERRLELVDLADLDTLRVACLSPHRRRVGEY